MNFRDFVLQRLTQLGWGETDLSTKLGYESSGYLWNVLNGLRPPPLKKVDEWIAALQLDDTDAQTFRLLAEAEHVPALTKLHWERVMRRLEAAEAAVAAQRAELDKLIAEHQQVAKDYAALLAEKRRCENGNGH